MSKTDHEKRHDFPNIHGPSTTAQANNANDARLIKLRQLFDSLTDKFDDDTDHSTDEFFSKLVAIENEIIETQARSIDGYRVKARAACWALLGDLYVKNEPTTDRRMALSIVRDLIREFDPQLEQPGALARLIEHP